MIKLKHNYKQFVRFLSYDWGRGTRLRGRLPRECGIDGQPAPAIGIIGLWCRLEISGERDSLGDGFFFLCLWYLVFFL